MIAVALDQALRFVLLGAATGALTGLVGLGIVLVYRASGVLNFAAGALGAVGAFVCYSLRDDHGLPSWLAMVVGLLVGGVLGAATFVLMSLIRRASLLAKLIATLAVLSAAMGAMTLIWGIKVTQPESYLPTRQITLFAHVRVGIDRLVLIGVVLLLATVLKVVYTKTRFGLATSAVAENRRVASSAGWSTGVIEFVNYTAAGIISAFAAIMLAPILTLTASVLSLAVLGAVAAALVGRFSSFGVTVLAALGIGIVQSEVSLYQPNIASAIGVSVGSLVGLAQTTPLLIILGYTIISGRGRLARGETLVRLPLPGAGVISVVPFVVGIGGAIWLLIGVQSLADALGVTFGIGIIVCSIVVVSGYAGQLSLCQYALGGFGAWIASKAIVRYGVPFELAIVLGVVGAIVAGVVVALPALRTRGVNLAVATLALALLFSALIFTNSSLTGGFNGTKVPSPRFFGIDIDPIDHPQRYGALLLVVFVLIALIVANVRRGRIGRRMLAVRSNERAAAALGISVTGVKMYAFGLGAGIAAVGGVLLAFRQQTIQFQSFDVFSSILVVQYAVLGGLGWASGAPLGAVPAPGGLLARLVSDLFPHFDNITAVLAIVGALGVVQIIRAAPDGAAALWSSTSVGRIARRWKMPRTVVATEPAPAAERRAAAELVVRDVTVRFGGVTAVDGVSFTIPPGEVVGLIGPNGAGKTTLLDVITGFTRPHSGSIELDGVDVSRWSAERRARAGMARSWQSVELFDELTVRDNILIGCDPHDRRRYVTDLVRPGRQQLTRRALEVIHDFGLEGVLDVRPSALPQGHARLVGIARAIAGESTLLLLDEPAAGLGPEESAHLAGVIRMIAERHGIGVLVIEHDVPLLMSICDRIIALDFGSKIAEGPPDAVSHDENVIKAYLGEPHETLKSARAEVMS